MKALNRKEAIVNAKANDTLDSFKPLTRDEAFIKKALDLAASSWNDLTDKPFGEEVTGWEITWDGNTEGLVQATASDGSIACKVSDLTPDVDSLLGGKVTIADGENTLTHKLDETYIQQIKDTGFVPGKYAADEAFIIIYQPSSIGGLEFPEAGVYFPKYNQGHTASLSTKKEIIRKIDPKYLPPLTSPNGTQYKLTVSDDGTLSATAV